MASVSPDRICKCGAVMGPSRTLCASCRGAAKREYLRAQRSPNHTMLQVIWPSPSPLPPPPCLMCGIHARGGIEPALIRFAGAHFCELCANVFSGDELKHTIATRQISGHPMACICRTCRSTQNVAHQLRVTRERQHKERNPAPPMFFASIHAGHATGPLLAGPHAVHAMHPSGPLAAAHAATRGFGGQVAPGGPRRPEPPYSLEDPDPDRAPDLIEPVLAWRGWDVTVDGHLVAAAQSGIWDAGPNKALCNQRNHTDVPAVGCSCGFYGWHRAERIAHGEIWGALKCWGEIIVHDVGIRAEYAEIVCLVEKESEPLDPHLLARVVDRYKVPVVHSLEEAQAVATKQGILVPESMKPSQDPIDEGGVWSTPTATQAAQAMQTMAAASSQVAANMLAVSAAASKCGTFMLPWETAPQPSGRQRLVMRSCLYFALVGAWLASGALRGWSGVAAICAVYVFVWCVPWPGVAFRAWRRFRGLLLVDFFAEVVIGSLRDAFVIIRNR